MALNWNLTKCNNWESLQENEQWPATNSLIWVTLGIEIHNITEQNVVEFYARTVVWESVVGELMYDRAITFDDVFARIGLETFVTNFGLSNRKKPLAQWFNRLERIIKEDNLPINRDNLKATYYTALTDGQKQLENKKETANA